MNQEIEINVARLDGYLSGIVSLSGRIRDYSAFAFLVKSNRNEASIETAIREFFLPHATLNFTSVDKLVSGFRDLETEIRPYLIRNILGVNKLLFDQDEIITRAQYLSFRVMDLISGIVNRNSLTMNVYKLEGSCEESCSQAVFFGMYIEESFLILQFNNDTTI